MNDFDNEPSNRHWHTPNPASGWSQPKSSWPQPARIGRQRPPRRNRIYVLASVAAVAGIAIVIGGIVFSRPSEYDYGSNAPKDQAIRSWIKSVCTSGSYINGGFDAPVGSDAHGSCKSRHDETIVFGEYAVYGTAAVAAKDIGPYAINLNETTDRVYIVALKGGEHPEDLRPLDDLEGFVLYLDRPGSSETTNPSAKPPNSASATTSADPSVQTVVGGACSDPRAISIDVSTGQDIVCASTGSGSPQWVQSAPVSPDVHAVGDPCNPAADTVARDDEGKAIICGGTTWAATP